VVTTWGTVLLGAWLLGAAAHPMHTSVTEIVEEADGRSVRIGMRLFGDDLAKAIEAAPDSAGSDSLISGYVRSRFVLADAAGLPVPLQWNGAELVGDVVQVRMRAVVTQGLVDLQLANSMLCERFEDQVNVVRVSYHGRAATLIFTPGDSTKPLP
jgi:hypothetical protein